MKTFKQFILEKTFNVDEDVDFLYKKSKMDKFINAIQESNEDYIFSTLKANFISGDGGYLFLETTSKILRSEDGMKAHELNPVTLRLGMFPNGSYYKPKEKIIYMSLNYNAFGLASNSNFNKKSIEKYLDHKSERFFNEFSSKSFKATIYHELTHWIDDTLHNKFITKKIEKAKDGDLKGKLGSVNHANFEINSQIHAIKQIKREMSQEDFDDLTWENLFKKKSSLMSNFKNFKDEKTYNIFINNFVKRLHKEGLLPKKMNRIPSWLKMQIILKSI